MKAIHACKQLALVAAIALGLVACGGDDTAKPAAAPQSVGPNPHVLKDQQQLLKDAKGVQDMLDQDAANKKKALEETN